MTPPTKSGYHDRLDNFSVCEFEYPSYYGDEDARRLAKTVKQTSDKVDKVAYGNAVQEMALACSKHPLLSCESILIPAPQHTGRAEYTKDIAYAIASIIGAEVHDIIACKPHRSLYTMRNASNVGNADVGSEDIEYFKIGDDIKEDDRMRRWFLVDNVMTTGSTLFSISDVLDMPIVPLVAAIDYTSFERWRELEDMLSVVVDAENAIDATLMRLCRSNC